MPTCKITRRMNKHNPFRQLSLLIVMLSPLVSQAQFSVGLRPSLSSYGGFDDRRRAEISMMTGTFGQQSRMEFDVGWGHRMLTSSSVVTLSDGQQTLFYNEQRQNWGSLTVLYQQSHKVLWKLYYYAGFGASAFVTSDRLEILGVDVLLGLELRLKVPLQLTLDYRPMLDVLDGMAYYHTVGLGVRYQFRMPEPEPEPKFWKHLKQKLL